MDNISSKAGHLDVDLEKGGLSGELSSSGGLVFGFIRMNQLCYEPVNRGFASCSDGSVGGEEGVKLCVNSNCSDGSENVKSIVGDKKGGEKRCGNISDKKQVREKPKVMSAKKPPKPPRPPRGLSLDSADQKLIRELNELAKLKRARIERMKALKKAKETKAGSSSKNHLFATLLTVFFGLVLLFQGISSRSHSAANFQGSPISSGTTEGSLISIQQHRVPSASNVEGPEYESPRLGLDTRGDVSSAVG